MSKKYLFFADYELACRCGCGGGTPDMSPAFMARLIALRRVLNVPMPVTSAYRCPTHNDAVSSTGLTGPHTTGHSVDIQVSGETAYWLGVEATALGFTGIGVRQHGPWDKRIVHLDDLEAPDFPRPRIWSY